MSVTLLVPTVNAVRVGVWKKQPASFFGEIQWGRESLIVAPSRSKTPDPFEFSRVALAGVNAISQLAVAVNGQSVGAIGDGRDQDNARLINTNTIRYNSNKGLWQERTLRFNAALLKPGENTMTLTVPGGDLQSGVVWDYLRLEVDDGEKP